MPKRELTNANSSVLENNKRLDKEEMEHFNFYNKEHRILTSN